MAGVLPTRVTFAPFLLRRPQQSKRPTVEELDRLPRPKAVSRETGLALREYQARSGGPRRYREGPQSDPPSPAPRAQVSSALAAKQRDVKAREDELERREAALGAAEARLREREAAVAARAAEVARREAVLTQREEEARRHSMGDRPSLAAFAQQQQPASARAPLHRAFSAGDVMGGPGAAPGTAAGTAAPAPPPLSSIGGGGSGRVRSLSGASAPAPPPSSFDSLDGGFTPMLDTLMGGSGAPSSRPATPQYPGLTVPAEGGAPAAPPALRPSSGGGGAPPTIATGSAAGAFIAKPQPLMPSTGSSSAAGGGAQNVPMVVDAPPALGSARPGLASAAAPRLGVPPRY